MPCRVCLFIDVRVRRAPTWRPVAGMSDIENFLPCSSSTIQNFLLKNRTLIVVKASSFMDLFNFFLLCFVCCHVFIFISHCFEFCIVNMTVGDGDKIICYNRLRERDGS